MGQRSSIEQNYPGIALKSSKQKNAPPPLKKNKQKNKNKYKKNPKET
jgi:hypothetical protein